MNLCGLVCGSDHKNTTITNTFGLKKDDITSIKTVNIFIYILYVCIEIFRREETNKDVNNRSSFNCEDGRNSQSLQKERLCFSIL